VYPLLTDTKLKTVLEIESEDVAENRTSLFILKDLVPKFFSVALVNAEVVVVYFRFRGNVK